MSKAIAIRTAAATVRAVIARLAPKASLTGSRRRRPGGRPALRANARRAATAAASRASCLCRPGRRRMGGGAQDPDSPAGVLDHREHVQPHPGQGDRLEEVTGQQGPGPGAQEIGPRGGTAPGRRAVPASCGISQTVEAATITPGTSSSPCTRRYPDPGFSRTRGNTRTRTERTVRGRPGCRGRDRRACRRAATWRCQRSTVSGRTTKCSRLSTSLGSWCSSAASNARSPGVNRTLSGPSCRCRTEKLVAQREDLRVFVPAAHRQQPRREHVRHTKIGQPQQHGRSPCHNNPPSHERPTGRHRAQHRPHPCIGSASIDEVSGRSKAGVGQQPPLPSPSPAISLTIP